MSEVWGPQRRPGAAFRPTAPADPSKVVMSPYLHKQRVEGFLFRFVLEILKVDYS
jgi:hypothetical protein